MFRPRYSLSSCLLFEIFWKRRVASRIPAENAKNNLPKLRKINALTKQKKKIKATRRIRVLFDQKKQIATPTRKPKTMNSGTDE